MLTSLSDQCTRWCNCVAAYPSKFQSLEEYVESLLSANLPKCAPSYCPKGQLCYTALKLCGASPRILCVCKVHDRKRNHYSESGWIPTPVHDIDWSPHCVFVCCCVWQFQPNRQSWSASKLAAVGWRVSEAALLTTTNVAAGLALDVHEVLQSNAWILERSS